MLYITQYIQSIISTCNQYFKIINELFHTVVLCQEFDTWYVFCSYNTSQCRRATFHVPQQSHLGCDYPTGTTHD